MSFFSIFRAVAANISQTIAGQSKLPAVVRLGIDVLFFLPSLIFAAKMNRYENDTGMLGFPKASSRMLRRMYSGTSAFGPIPAGEGARLILSNHPGAGDTLSLLSVLERDDVLVVGTNNAFIRPFRNLQKSLILLDPLGRNRVETFQHIVRALKDGKWVVLYPAGSIEPDPYWYPELESPFRIWFRSVGTLVRIARQEGWDFDLQTVVVSRINSRRSLDNYCLSAISDRSVKEKLSILHMLVLESARRWKTRLNFSRVRRASEFGQNESESTKAYEQRVADTMRDDAWAEVKSRI